jgi:Tfp pilus assembly protein PilN
MNALTLNHAPNSRGWTRSHILLIFGLLFLSFVFMYAQKVSHEVNQLSAELQTLSQRQKQVSRPTLAKTTSSQDKAIEVAVDEILLPWNSLFKALESANHEGIQMLAIEPNPKSKLVRIKAIALDTESMMRYLNNLDAQKTLGKVHLVSHEVVEMNGQSAIELVVEAIWNV